jgi:NTE family protein
MESEAKTALVLSGGGARAAYQVGVLRGLLDIGALSTGIDILAGSSAGSINAGAIAARADDLPKAIAALERIWGKLEIEQVFRTDIQSLGTIGARWAWDLTFGGAFGHVAAKALVDTSPLRALLNRVIPVRQISANIESGALQALAVAATDLQTAEGTVFLQAAGEVPLWQRRRWRVERTVIGIDHLLASSAIPILFPAVAVGGRYFADGCIRNTAPLSPAINLGADRIIAIGVRGTRTPSPPVASSRPSIGQIAGVLLDAVMMDSIESDVEHTEHINTGVITFPTREGNPFRWIDVLWIQPSSDVAAVAAELEDRIPNVVRYLLRGLGSDETLIELASYLLFDAAFCGRLIELGRADVAAASERIQQFFNGDRRALSVVSGDNLSRYAAS